MVSMFSCILAIFTIDRYGRRSVLIVGALGQSIAFFILGALSKVGADKQSAAIGAAAGSFVFVYNFIFAVSVAPFPRSNEDLANDKYSQLGSACLGFVSLPSQPNPLSLYPD